MTVVQSLIDLQEVDGRIRELELELKDLPRRKAQETARLSGVSADLQAAKANQELANQRVKGFEEDAKALREKIQQLTKKDIPVFCPALQDSMIGLQYWMFNQTGGVTIDAFKDMSKLMDICFAAKKSGAFLVGGGVPKNYIFQSRLMTPEGFDYAIQLTGDRPDLGGLSGATLDEAKSWGKLTEDATSQTVYGDATINLPLIVAATLERLQK